MWDIKGLDVEDILEWPRRVQFTAILLLSVLILLFGSKFVLLPMLDKLTALKLSEDSKKSLIQTKSREVLKLYKLSDQKSALSRTYAEMSGLFVSEHQRASVLSSINRLALENNLVLKELRWEEKQSNEHFNLLPLEISLTGQFNDIGYFSEQVASLPQIISFNKTRWSRADNDNQLLNLQITAYGYQHRKEAQ